MAAFALSTLSNSVAMLMVTYGIVGGIGFGLIYLPAIVSVGYYFEKKRALATGIAVCGSGFGTFVFAPLAAMLLEHYDWKGANLILAGIIFNCAVSFLSISVRNQSNSHDNPLFFPYSLFTTDRFSVP
jgi:MFS family permease